MDTPNSERSYQQYFTGQHDLLRKAGRFTRAKPAPGAKPEMRREARRLKADARLLEQQAVKSVLDRADAVGDGREVAEPELLLVLHAERAVVGGDMVHQVLVDGGPQRFLVFFLPQRRAHDYLGALETVLEVQGLIQQQVLNTGLHVDLLVAQSGCLHPRQRLGQREGAEVGVNAQQFVQWRKGCARSGACKVNS